MMNIPVPLVLSIAVAAVPSIVSVLVAFKMSRKRKAKKEMPRIRLETAADTATFGHEMYQQLLEQQIDTIFQSLSTLIESECVKLKAVARSWSMAAQEARTLPPEERAKATDPISIATPLTAPQPKQPPDMLKRKDDLGEIISSCVEMRMTPEEIAKKLNLSLFEVSLAMRMRGVSKKVQKPADRLEAVA